MNLSTNNIASINSIINGVWNIEELTAVYKALEVSDGKYLKRDQKEALTIKAILDELQADEGYAIAEDDFQEYCEGEAEEMGWLGTGEAAQYIAIDWKQTAANMAAAHQEIVIDGTKYFYRA